MITKTANADFPRPWSEGLLTAGSSGKQRLLLRTTRTGVPELHDHHPDSCQLHFVAAQPAARAYPVQRFRLTFSIVSTLFDAFRPSGLF